MGSWHLAPALNRLLREVNTKWPGRSKASDGTIGDAAHSARDSDHNPNSRGSVDAIDITAKGISTAALIAAAKRHPSVRYIIFNRKIMNRDIRNFAPRAYTGSNPHTQHVHISLYQSAVAENRMQAWGLATSPPGSPAQPRGLGVDGKWGTATTSRLQEVLGTPVDGKVTGQPRTYRAANPGLMSGWQWVSAPSSSMVIAALQRKLGVSADGRIGPKTITALQRKLRTPADGRVSKPSGMVKRLQNNLNQGRVW